MKQQSLSALTCLTLVAAVLPAQESDLFQQVQPILESSCLKCHGAAIQLGKLDLRTRESALRGGEHGPSIVPGDAAKSKLFRLVAGLEKPSMPMDGKLPEAGVAAIRKWIDGGAHWPAAAEVKSSPDAAKQLAASEEMEIPAAARSYWAFRKPVRAVTELGKHPIDLFLERTLAARKLTPAPRAERTVLVRRAYLDLVGLPPTPAEVDSFVNDRSENAWPVLIDRLLASPHYGERWGRHWLDVARYADSNGFEHDYNRPNAWRYRDYVIASFNRDTPYNVFLREQLAGDEIENVTHDSLIATGFLRNHAKVGYREKDNPEFRYDYLDDMIATIGRGVLGMTVQCARCHNHKFDPISQKDYYRLQASLFGYVEVDHPLVSREEAAAHRKKTEEIEERLTPFKQELKRLEKPYQDLLLPAKYKVFPANVQEAIATPEEKRTPGQAMLANQILLTVRVPAAEIVQAMKPDDLAAKRRLEAEIKAIEAERPKPLPVAMGITDGDYRFTPDGPGDEPAPGKGVKKQEIAGSFLHSGAGRYQAPPSHFLYKGDPHSQGSEMQPGFLTVATSGREAVELPPATGKTSGRRLAMAEWLTSSDNPLTARVMVNRIWHHHFGRGLVATLDNFGKMGETPTHPELLDWLATEFADRGWSIKQMHRLLMTSNAYQMASDYESPANTAIDPQNHFLWRFRIQRLDAEIVRDAMLAVSGGLNREMGGPAVFPPLAKDILSAMKNGIWERQEEGPGVWKRSVYVYRKRGLPFPLFEVFDLPDQNVSCGARNISTVPTQALTLMNNPFVLNQAKLFSRRLEESFPSDTAKQAEMAYRHALSRVPTEAEKKLASDFMKTGSLSDFTHVLFNLNEFLYNR